jgi:hypothetical protein
VDKDGATGTEAKAKYGPNQASLAAAAASVAEQDKYRQEQASEARMKRLMRGL